MNRRPNIYGGGSKTNLNGLRFEGRVSLRGAIENHPHYRFDEYTRVLNGDKVVAQYFEKYGLYKKLLEPNGINYKDYISKKLLPDGALLVGKTIYIIEKKYQEIHGSVDEKLQTCDFKMKQYQKLFNPLNIKVEFFFVLSTWFNQPCYKDVLEYIESVGCKFFFEEIPLTEFGIIN